MDNLCHTLAGAAIGEAGLKTRTRFGNATLMVAANLPDIDVLVFATSAPAVTFRRGWTHGVLAMAVLPLLLTAFMMAWDRWRPRRDTAGPPARLGMLLLLSYVGVGSHVLLDLLNNYGVRLLMPFSGRWFYGDTLFIVDIWLWLILGAGVWMSWKRRVPAPARRALVAAGIYIFLMFTSARVSRQMVLNAWIEKWGGPPIAWMVGPVPVNPFSKAIIVDAGNHFERGRFSWFGTRVRFDAERLPNLAEDPTVLKAEQDPRMQAVLRWTRFPYFVVTSVPGGHALPHTDPTFGSILGGTTVVVPD
jgi:inner membrane protein